MGLGGDGIIKVSIGGFGLETRIRELATFGHSIETLAPAWEQVGEDFLEDFAQNFAQEGGFFGGTRSYLGEAGGKWKPLADSTKADRQRHGYGREHPILERTGQLRQSLTERMTPGNIFEVGSNSLTVGTDDPIAVFHQDGTQRTVTRHSFRGEGYSERKHGTTGDFFGEHQVGVERMPARPIVGISWKRRSAMLDRIRVYIKQQVEASGLQG